MKTTINRTIDKLFQGAAILGISTLFLSTGSVYAQPSGLLQPLISTTPIADELQAKIFSSLDPLKLKIVFVNPAKESITLVVKNDKLETVYKKAIKKTRMYNSSFDVSGLPDGNYIFAIIGKSSQFSEKIQISTQTSRLTYVQ